MRMSELFKTIKLDGRRTTVHSQCGFDLAVGSGLFESVAVTEGVAVDTNMCQYSTDGTAAQIMAAADEEALAARRNVNGCSGQPT